MTDFIKETWNFLVKWTFTTNLQENYRNNNSTIACSTGGALSPLVSHTLNKNPKHHRAGKTGYRLMSGKTKAASEAFKRIAESVAAGVGSAAIYDGGKSVWNRVATAESKEIIDSRQAAAEHARLVRREQLIKLAENQDGRQSPSEGVGGSMLPSPIDYFHDTISFDILLLMATFVIVLAVFSRIISLFVEMRILKHLNTSQESYIASINNFYRTVSFACVGFLSPALVDVAKYIAFRFLDNSFSEDPDSEISSTDLLYFLDSFAFKLLVVSLLSVVVFVISSMLKARAIKGPGK